MFANVKCNFLEIFFRKYLQVWKSFHNFAAFFEYKYIMKERDRLEQVIESEQMTAKQFAAEVGIQAGTISNILSGRNNPSLDVMQRVLNRFRTLSSDWLILGVGSMYRKNGEGPDNALFDIRPDEPVIPAAEPTDRRPDEPQLPLAATAPNTAPNKKVEKIIIFYSDGTFEER